MDTNDAPACRSSAQGDSRARYDDIKAWLAIIWLTIAACAIPIYAIAQRWHYIAIVAAEEDDCALYHGAYVLSEVTPIGVNGHAVKCIYK